MPKETTEMHVDTCRVSRENARKHVDTCRMSIKHKVMGLGNGHGVMCTCICGMNSGEMKQSGVLGSSRMQIILDTLASSRMRTTSDMPKSSNVQVTSDPANSGTMKELVFRDYCYFWLDRCGSGNRGAAMVWWWDGLLGREQNGC
jgi:hypothetical protein